MLLHCACVCMRVCACACVCVCLCLCVLYAQNVLFLNLLILYQVRSASDRVAAAFMKLGVQKGMCFYVYA